MVVWLSGTEKFMLARATAGLIAIDAATTKKLWEATVCEPLQTGITGAPASRAGKSLWATTARMMECAAPLPLMTQKPARKSGGSGLCPGDPAKGFETKELEMASKTWIGENSWKIGGGDVWHAITYDDTTGLVIFGTAGADVGYGEMTGIKIAGRKTIHVSASWP